MPYRTGNRRFATYRRHAWGVSLALHLAVGAAAWAVTPPGWDRRPELIGQTSRVELLATTTDDQFTRPPQAAAVAAEPVRITPSQVDVARHRFRIESTEVSHPGPRELARVERLLRVAPSPSRAARADRADSPPVSDATPTPPGHTTLPSRETVRAAAGSPLPGTVDRPLPELIDNPPPEYPRAAIERRIEGLVLLRVHVGIDGSAARIEVMQSSGHRVLDAEAIRAIRQWRFIPARRGGTPIATTVQLPVRFVLSADR
ncbi:MAG: TonB family protein [Pirellulales bacterium]